MFDRINDQQLLWYSVQISLDMQEQFETLRDVAEYNAMFMNPEGVQKVRDSRDNTFETNDDDFNQLLKDTFGRGIPEIDENDKSDVFDIVKMLQKEREPNSSVMDMELDEIVFTPFK